MGLSLSDRLTRYLRNNPKWFPKGELCDIAREATGATGEYTGRELRKLAEDGVLEVKHVKNHAWYRYSDARESIIRNVPHAIEVFDALPN